MDTARILRILCHVQRPKTEATPNAMGQVEWTNPENWETVATRAFEVMPRSGREFIRAQKQDRTITHVLRTHWDSETRLITGKYRLQVVAEPERLLNVTAAYNVDEQNRHMQLDCQEAK